MLLLESSSCAIPRRAILVLREDEAEIIREILDGDKERYRILVDRYSNQITGMIMRQTSDRDLSADLSQEIFIKAFKSLRTFRFESRFSTWLTRIAINHLNSFFTSTKWKTRLSEIRETQTQIEDSAPNPEQFHLEKERLTKLQLAITELKPKYREVLTLCALEEHSYEKAAQILGIPVGTVRSRLNTARLILSRKMKI